MAEDKPAFAGLSPCCGGSSAREILGEIRLGKGPPADYLPISSHCLGNLDPQDPLRWGLLRSTMLSAATVVAGRARR